MDRVTKVILGMIAAALCVISIELYAFAPPTISDFRALSDIKDSEKHDSEMQKLVNRVPLVMVRGGSMSVQIENMPIEIEGSVSIDR